MPGNLLVSDEQLIDREVSDCANGPVEPARESGLIRKHQISGGVIYGHAEGASIGPYVRDLELIAKTCSPGEFRSQVLHLPL